MSNIGIESFLGKSITIFCANYIYTGTLEGICDEGSIRLSNAHIVYETGELTAKQWKDAQSLGGDWYISPSAIESFGPGK